jgi:cholesterol transport system auxiliary component
VKLNRFLIAASALLLLAGCAGKGSVPTLYDFGPMGPSSMAPVAMPQMALVVADATGPAWLDSRTMYYRLLYADAQQSHPYANNHWNSTPLQLLSARLKSRIAQAGGKVLSVTDASAGAMLLRIEVDDFSQNFDSQQASSGKITLRASIFQARRLIGQKTFIHTTAANSADAVGGARALAQASDAVAADLIAWLAALQQKE